MIASGGVTPAPVHGFASSAGSWWDTKAPGPVAPGAPPAPAQKKRWWN